MAGQTRRAQHADRLRQVAGRDGAALQGARRGADVVLHVARSRRWSARSSSPSAACSAPERVGMLTGDASINRDAPIVCCTAEILANMALRERRAPARTTSSWTSSTTTPTASAGWRGRCRCCALDATTFLLMSATLGDMRVITDGTPRPRPGARSPIVRGRQRPVPLEFEYRETPLHETIDDLTSRAGARRSTSSTSPSGAPPTRRRT